MNNDNTYVSVKKDAVCEITVKRSKFICNIAHAESENAASEFINKIKKLHYNAKHNVFAYVLKNGAKKYTDDGEPSKTAGLPILELLEKHGVTDTVCVVTRYFGGILLGTGGLVRAYTDAAKAGLEAAGTVAMNMCDVFELCLPYSLFKEAEYDLKSLGGVTESCSYAENIVLTAYCRHELCDKIFGEIGEKYGKSIVITKKGQAYREL